MGQYVRPAVCCPANLTNFAAEGSERRLTVTEKYLGLIGPEDSVYLRLIQREAEKTGLPVLQVSQRDERRMR
jgi:hypothetical protein